MPRRPWYRWFVADWRADTRRMSLEERGFYREVLDELFTTGPIPDDYKAVARIVGEDPRVVRRLWTVIRPFLSRSYPVSYAGSKDTLPALVDHPKIAEQRTQADEFSEKQRQRVRKRWDTAGNTSPDPDLSGSDLRPNPSGRRTPSPRTDAEIVAACDRAGIATKGRSRDELLGELRRVGA